MRVLITRPASDAPVWVAALQRAGYDAQAIALIDIAAEPDVQPIDQAWSQWAKWQAVMFVSAPAVRYFFARQPEAYAWRDVHTRCWATGPGTQKALLKAGVPPELIDCPNDQGGQFDSEALWQEVHARVAPGLPVLIVRGRDLGHQVLTIDADANANGFGRDWLAQQLQGVQVPVHFVVAYQRQAPVWTEAQRSQAALAVTDGSVWCLSSSQAVAHLRLNLPALDWSRSRCIVTHARIGLAAQALGFGQVLVARPVLADVLASLESLA